VTPLLIASTAHGLSMTRENIEVRLPNAPPRLLAMALCLGEMACVTDRPFGGAAYCAPPTEVTFAFASDPSPPSGASREERTAALLGLRDVLSQSGVGEGSRVRALERIALARLAIGATVAELRCESARAKLAADAVARAQAQAVQGMTIASIGASAATAIAAVFLATHNARATLQEGVTVGGGTVTAAFALGSLAVHPRAPFAHARNLLVDVWQGPQTSRTYPPFVWAYLSRPEFSNDGHRSIREGIVERWVRFEGLGEDSALVALVLGEGGHYDADGLRTRAVMLDEIAAEVELASQDVEALAVRVLRD
jgi:hypothetical protein